MAGARRTPHDHKVVRVPKSTRTYIEVPEGTWRTFRAMVVQKGTTVPAYLGQLVEREVKRANRRA